MAAGIELLWLLRVARISFLFGLVYYLDLRLLPPLFYLTGSNRPLAWP